mmetsp:Transcript_28561/g.45892  ORF Transcript_28561/g.45892 Transcript_28561/m.45892 type:complete len:588 (-) Transcript_28561:141-1904(-)
MAEEKPQKEPEKKESPTRYSGRPVQVVCVENTGEDGKDRKIVVDEDALQEVLDNVEKTGLKKMYIVSLVGAMRTGKSFMLDLFLRYLTEPTENTEKDPGCIFAGTDLNEEKESQFYWRAHQDRTTTGIWFYSTPFVRTIKGQKVCVLLMDTQGLFDPLSPPAINNAIFGLSVLISSFQVLNVQNRIQEDTLQQLDYFTQFARSALRLFKSKEELKNAEKDGKEDDISEHKFQNLQFLVRDWANFDDPEDVEENIKQTKDVLEDTLAENFKDGGQRERIMSSFEKVDAFFIPHIGLEPLRKKWTGNLDDCEPGFKKMTGHFLRDVFDRTLVVKKDIVRNIELTPKSLGYYITSFTEVFKDGQMPEAVSLFTAMTKATTLEARERAIEKYKGIMDSKAGPNKPYVKQEVLDNTMQKALEEARSEFKKIAAFGDQKQREDALLKVVDYLQEEGKRYEEANRNRVDKILAGSAMFALIATVAFILDFLSDYTCDWWSDTCVEGSRLMKFIYTLAAMYIGTQVFFLYQGEGQIVMFKALGGLWAEASHLGMQYYQEFKETEFAKEVGFTGVVDLAAKEEQKKGDKLRQSSEQ